MQQGVQTDITCNIQQCSVRLHAFIPGRGVCEVCNFVGIRIARDAHKDRYVVVQFYTWFKFRFFCFGYGNV